MEVTSAGVQRAYVMSGSSVVAQLNPNGSFYWVHLDHLGSGRKMTDSAGNMVYRAEFDPYGKLLYEWSSPTNLNTRKFTGYERDAATNLDYAQARMYGSDWGRFMSPDPAGMSSASLTRPRSLNRYAYVEGNPINAIDPAGANLWGWIQGLFGGVFGGNGAGAGFLANDDNYWNWFYWQLPQWIDAPYLPNPEPTEPEPIVSTFCHIQLGSRPIDNNLLRIYHHMFVTTQTISTDPTVHKAKTNVFHAFNEEGYLRAHMDDFGPSDRDFLLSRGHHGIFGEFKLYDTTCANIDKIFFEVVAQTNRREIEYEYGLKNPVKNSNAFAYTLLKKINYEILLRGRWEADFINKLGEANLITYITPGWGTDLH